jgi:hypothetical protein
MGGIPLNRALVLLALLATLPLALPPTAADATCDSYSSETVRVVPTHYARLSSYRCAGTVGDYTYAQRVNIVRFAEDASDRIIAQLEVQSITARFPDGRETHEHFVSLRDTAGPLGYTELEYADSRPLGGECTGAVSAYRGSQYGRVATAGTPCLPVLPLLP